MYSSTPEFLTGVYYIGATCVFDATTYAIFTSKISINAQNEEEEKRTSEKMNENNDKKSKIEMVMDSNP